MMNDSLNYINSFLTVEQQEALDLQLEHNSDLCFEILYPACSTKSGLFIFNKYCEDNRYIAAPVKFLYCFSSEDAKKKYIDSEYYDITQLKTKNFYEWLKRNITSPTAEPYIFSVTSKEHNKIMVFAFIEGAFSVSNCVFTNKEVYTK